MDSRIGVDRQLLSLRARIPMIPSRDLPFETMRAPVSPGVSPPASILLRYTRSVSWPSATRPGRLRRGQPHTKKGLS
jgi:hypothetical protein